MLGVVLVAAGAAVGAPLRYLVDRVVQARHATGFPWGTFAVNVLGSLVLGGLAGAALSGSTVQLLVGTGFCGALTTWSTLGFETFRLAETGQRVAAAANLLGSVLAGVGAVFLGLTVAQALV